MRGIAVLELVGTSPKGAFGSVAKARRRKIGPPATAAFSLNLCVPAEFRNSNPSTDQSRPTQRISSLFSLRGANNAVGPLAALLAMDIGFDDPANPEYQAGFVSVSDQAPGAGGFSAVA